MGYGLFLFLSPNSLAIKNISNKTILIIILSAAAVLRLVALTHQSFWLDELHTVNVSDPRQPWSELFRILKCCDQHPPLYFVLERLVFMGLGYTEWTARILSVVAGVLSIYAIYRFGKELLNERLGLTAAAITALNMFHLDHSQEARAYTLLWLLVTLSYFFFIRLFKYQKPRDAVYYVLSTAGVLYTHYFSLMMLCCQAILGIIFLAAIEDRKRIKLLTTYLLSAAAIVLLYLPLVSFLKGVTATNTTWIGKLTPGFLTSFYYEYFNNAIFVFSPLLLYFAYRVIRQFSISAVSNDPLVLTGVLAFVSIFFAYLIPYVRSVNVIAMMVPRYTIIVIPSYILAISYGFELVANERWRRSLLSIALLLSLADIFFIKRYYAVRYAQFRQMTEYMSAGGKNYVVINDRCAWQQKFYREKYGYTGPVYEGAKEAWVDSILSGCIKADTFWIVGAHGDPKLETSKRCDLDTAFTMVKEKDFHDAWAQLFVRRQH